MFEVLKSLRQRHTLPLAVAAMASLSLMACARGPSASALKIRGGEVVSSASVGPERLSTAGLSATTGTGSYTCSAAIIAPDVLVTAAHCVQQDAQIYAFFGLDMRRASADEFVPVSGASVDPGFNLAQLDSAGLPADDVAVLHLSSPVPAGFTPAPILPDDGVLTVGEQVILAGYGITEQGHDSGVLRYTPTTFAGPDRIGRLQIKDQARRGACSGDSGGPFFAQVDGVAYVAGVLSGGPIPCRGVNLYTSLAAHRGFIEQAVATFSN